MLTKINYIAETGSITLVAYSGETDTSEIVHDIIITYDEGKKELVLTDSVSKKEAVVPPVTFNTVIEHMKNSEWDTACDNILDIVDVA